MDEFRRAECSSTLLALVAVGVLIAAVRAGAGNVSIGQKLFCFRIIELLRNLFRKSTGRIQIPKKGLCRMVMNRAGGSGEIIKFNTPGVEGIGDDLVIIINDFLRSYAFFARFQRDGYPVFIGSANKQYVFPFRTKEANVDIAGEKTTGHVTDVERAIRVGKGAGNKVPLGGFHAAKIGRLSGLPNFEFLQIEHIPFTSDADVAGVANILKTGGDKVVAIPVIYFANSVSDLVGGISLQYHRF